MGRWGEGHGEGEGCVWGRLGAYGQAEGRGKGGYWGWEGGELWGAFRGGAVD